MLNLKKIEEELKTAKKILEKELEKFAEKDKNLPHDWNTKFPKLDEGVSSQAMEDEAEEVEAYVANLPIEHSLEIRLKDINLALEKINKKNYGNCEKCGKKISEERLKVCPEARTCVKCK